MAARLVVVSGTGTEIGKTHTSEALLLAWRARGMRAVGVKPVESGVPADGASDAAAPTDAARLARASSFHVKPFGVALRDPISPHLAARRQGVTIRAEPLVDAVRALLPSADLLLVELPGGLFSPLADDLLNAGLAARLAPDAVLLVAPDRLGVLHDTIATTRAAAATALRIDALLLVAPERPDASTGTNAAELARFVPLPVLATVGRGAPAELAVTPEIQRLASELLR
jgi:dethiobiotin synthetase